MSTYLQETDSRATHPKAVPWDMRPGSGKENYFLIPDISEETIGSSFNSNFFPLTTESNIIENALTKLRSRSHLMRGNHQAIIGEATKFLFKLEKIILAYQQYGYDFYNFPPIHAFFVEDGSILIEWIFEDFRIGFSFEQDIRESSWYLVSNQEFGEISASGYLSDIDSEKLMVWLLNFVLVNS